jgi:hypothetical protein
MPLLVMEKDIYGKDASGVMIKCTAAERNVSLLPSDIHTLQTTHWIGNLVFN